MRDLLVSAIVFTTLPAAFLRPWIGILLWSWISYMNPHRLCWGFAYDMRFAYMTAIATLGGLIFSGETKSLPRTSITTLLAVFWVWITLTTLLAYYPNAARPEWVEVSKILLITFATMPLVQDMRKIRYLVGIIALSLGFYGVKSGWAGISSGFSSRVIAYPPDSFIADNNDLALALNVALPLLLLLAREQKQLLLKGALYAISGLTVLGVFSTFSRGGFLGLAVTIAVLTLQSRRKALVLPLVVAGGFFVTSILSVAWYTRISTITESSTGSSNKDAAVQGRLDAWKISTRLALDSPITGGGFKTLQPEMLQRYGQDTAYAGMREQREAHSIYFQVLGEHGFVGLGIFLSFLGSTAVTLRRIIRAARTRPELGELADFARAIQASMAGFVASGAFLSRAYFDVFYHLVAIAAVLMEMARQRTSATSTGAVERPAVPGRIAFRMAR